MLSEILYPYQKEGVEFILTHRGCLLADEMGLGKTLQAIEAMNRLSVKNALIVCPSSLKLNWEDELKKYLLLDIPVHVIRNGKQEIPENSIIILNYDILTTYQNTLRGRIWDILICDESHYLKNEKANRTKEICGTSVKPGLRAKRKLFMTGTPILNRPSELWTTIKAMKQEDNFGGNFFKFGLKYCDGHKEWVGKKEVWNFKGSSNLSDLNKNLSDTIMIRREKNHVLKELPPIIYQTIKVECQPNESELVAEEDKLFQEHEEIKKRITVDFKDKTLKENRRRIFAQLSEARQNVAIMKIPYTLELLRSTKEKVVVFAHHRQVIDLLSIGLEKCVLLHGGMSDKERHSSVKAFQEDPEIQYFIGSLFASGVGLTLTAASHVVLHELDWTPGIIDQAISRCHRIGQKGSVLAQSIVFEKSLDEVMLRTLGRKRAVIKGAIRT